MSKFKGLSDQDIKDICIDICRRSDTAQDAAKKIKERFGVTASISFSKPNRDGPMIEGTIFGPEGNTISF